MTEKTDEEIIEKLRKEGVSLSDIKLAVILKIVKEVHEAEDEKHEAEIKEKINAVVKKIASCKNDAPIMLSDYCPIHRDMAVDLALLRFIANFWDLKPSEIDEMKSLSIE